MTRYDSHKLQRFKSSTEPSADTSTCETSRSLRSSSNAKNFSEKCFFCNQTAEDDVVLQCQAFYTELRVSKIAHELGDTKLLAKLSEGDMVVPLKLS